MKCPHCALDIPDAAVHSYIAQTMRRRVKRLIGSDEARAMQALATAKRKANVAARMAKQQENKP